MMQRKKPGFPGFSDSFCYPALQRADIRGLIAFGTRGFLVGHFLVLFKRLEPGSLDGSVMSDEILAAVIGSDESKSLCVVEPLHGTCLHVDLPELTIKGLLPEGWDSQEGIKKI